jgi:hypothetical protein
MYQMICADDIDYADLSLSVAAGSIVATNGTVAIGEAGEAGEAGDVGDAGVPSAFGFFSFTG